MEYAKTKTEITLETLRTDLDQEDNNTREQKEDVLDDYTLNDHGVGICHMCQVGLTSSKLAQEHVKGKKHQKKLQENRVLQSIRQESQTLQYPQSLLYGLDETDNKNLGSSAPSSDDESTGHERTSATSVLASKFSDEHGGQYICETCNVKCTSIEHLKAHEQGARHAKKVAQVQNAEMSKAGTFVDPCPWRCELCEKKLNTFQQLHNHLKITKSHQNLSEQDIDSFLKRASSQVADGHQINVAVIEVKETQTSSCVELNSWRCELCFKNLNTLSQLREHLLTTKAHQFLPQQELQGILDRASQQNACKQRRVSGMDDKEMRTKSDAELCPWKCDLCGKRLNTLIQLHQHLRTTKSHQHLSQQEIEEIVERASAQTAGEQQSAVSGEEGVSKLHSTEIMRVPGHNEESAKKLAISDAELCPWKCDLCGKRLNTLIQLRQHLRTTKSHQHLSQQEIEEIVERASAQTAGEQQGAVSGEEGGSKLHSTEIMRVPGHNEESAKKLDDDKESRDLKWYLCL